eukprot:NODE_9072_length_1448_cov_10.880394.p1 GENE.NODE_9072_length_1448_cov_10.880394~~NODE_9072_length_1448_cov_10.880394.p1  ORF type:complete len:379 (-),score=51.75 NODE_9072_length_1448_cov_10.880394:203-1339(-)
MDSNLVGSSHSWWTHPGAVMGWSVLVFVPCRFYFGGANYLPSRAWRALCLIIPGFVLVGILSGAFCIPIYADAPTLLHVALLYIYVQIDLLIARMLCGEQFGTTGVHSLLWSKVMCKSVDIADDLPAGILPIARTIYEVLGASFHEVFWNVFICENCTKHGLPLYIAILAVPFASCLMHGIVTNAWVGIRCFPIFLNVALSFHASGSIVVPALMHACWYLTDLKMCALLRFSKHDWDIATRTDESSTPPWGIDTTVGVILGACFYIPLNVLTHYYPMLTSGKGLDAADLRCGGSVWRHTVECAFVFLILAFISVGISTWSSVAVFLDPIAQNGDKSRDAMEKLAVASREWEEKRAGSACHNCGGHQDDEQELLCSQGG